MKALRLYAGPRALRHLTQHGLQPGHVGVIPAAAGGPKGLILGPLDRFLFGQWLPRSTQPVHLVGASIGAWRMATACLDDPVAAFARLEHDYIHQHYPLQPGEKRPPAHRVSADFGRSLEAFYGGRVQQVLGHPRYHLHILTSRGRHLLAREHPWRTPLGYLGAALSNTMQRKAMGAWLERVVFSSTTSLLPTTTQARQGGAHHPVPAPLPFATDDYRTRHLALTEANFMSVLQASCSIPFVLQAVSPIPGAPAGAYWDGGITDYHLHLNYAAQVLDASAPLVLYPHFQQAVVPGWLDKALRWRHRPSHFLDNLLLLAPDPEWVARLPHGKLPDRHDFTHYGNDLAGRVGAWEQAARMSHQLADEFAAWLSQPDLSQVHPL